MLNKTLPQLALGIAGFAMLAQAHAVGTNPEQFNYYAACLFADMASNLHVPEAEQLLKSKKTKKAGADSYARQNNSGHFDPRNEVFEYAQNGVTATILKTPTATFYTRLQFPVNKLSDKLRSRTYLLNTLEIKGINQFAPAITMGCDQAVMTLYFSNDQLQQVEIDSQAD